MRQVTIFVTDFARQDVRSLTRRIADGDERSIEQLLDALGVDPAAPTSAEPSTRVQRVARARALRIGDVDGLNRIFAPTTVEQEDVNAYFRANEADKPAKWIALVEKQDRRRGDD